MANIFSYVIAVGLLVGAYLAIAMVQRTYQSVLLTGFLALFVALPLVAAALKLKDGRPAFKNFMRTLFSSAAALLVVTLVHQRLTKSWVLACLAGMVLPGIVLAVQTAKTSQARLSLNQSIAKYNSADYRTALTLAQSALNAAVARGERALRAEAEYMVGLSFLQMGELARAARYLNHSKVNFGPKGSKKHRDHIATELNNLRLRGVDTEASAVSSEDEAKATGGMDAQIVLNGFIAIASVLACLQLWGLAATRASLAASLFIGAFLFLLFLGNYALAELVLCRTGKKGLASRLVLFNAALLASALGTLGTALGAKALAAADFPPALQAIPSAVEGLLASWPSWLFPVLIVAGLLLVVLDLALAAGRSPLGAIKEIAGGGGDKSLQLARTELDEGEWAKAIVQLSRIDLVKEKQAERRAEILFGLAFAHHKVGHPTEAEGYAKEVMETEPGNREGLYLLGYLQLQANQIDAAEATWRTLYGQAPGYRPPGDAKTDRSAKYYLCMTLDRKAMGVMASNVEAGVEALGEVGRLGTLDKSVADALARVHLYRTVEAIRRGDWASASSEIELVRNKLELLEKLTADATVGAKIAGYCEAALGLVAFQSERYPQASALFVKALDTTKALRPKLSFGGAKGGNFLEELLRPLLEAQGDSRTIDPRFPRDCRLLAAIASLHALKESAAKPQDIAAALEKIRDSLNEGVTLSPDFLEGLAILGLLWYHLGPDDDIRDKGIEALQKVRDRVSSRFISQTLVDHEKDKEVLKDARQAYFDMLQKYFLSADVPREQREALQKEVIERMKQRGLYESLMGRGGLDLQAEEEPSVQEYVDRARLLDAKIKQVLLSKRAAALSPKIKEKIETLNAQSGVLQKALGDISKLEMEILREALEIM